MAPPFSLSRLRDSVWLSRCRVALDSASEGFFSYTTVKLVQYKDRRLGLADKLLKLASVVVILVAVFFQHSFMRFERPTIAANFWVEGGEGLPAGTRQQRYCEDADIAYSQTWNYTNLTCVTGLSSGDVVGKGGADLLWITTFYSERTFRRSSSSTARRLRVNDSDAPWQHRYVAGATLQEVFLSAAYQTSRLTGRVTRWSVVDGRGRKVPLRLGGPKGAVRLDADSSDAVLVIPLERMQELLPPLPAHVRPRGDGLDAAVDARNDASGGIACKASLGADRDAIAAKCPRYRLTGMRVEAMLTFENTRMSRPNDYSVDCTVRFRLMSRHTWNSLGHSIEMLDRDPDAGVDVVRDRYLYGLALTFVAEGLLGATTLRSVLSAIASSTALFALTAFVLDVLGAFFVENFHDAKFDNDSELLLMRDLLERQKRTLLEGIPDATDEEVAEALRVTRDGSGSLSAYVREVRAKRARAEALREQAHLPPKSASTGGAAASSASVAMVPVPPRASHVTANPLAPPEPPL